MQLFRTYRELMAIRNVRWLVIVQCLSQMAFYSTVTVAFETGRGLTFAQMFWLESILAAALMAFEIPTGVLADRLGYRQMTRLGVGLCFASHVLFAVAPSFWVFGVSSALYGVGLACLSGCDSALLYESLPDGERERLSKHAFSLTGTASSFGFFAGLAAGSFMGAGNPAVAVYATLVPVGLAWLASVALEDRGGRADGEQPAGTLTLLREAGALARRDPVAVGLSLFGSAAFALINAIFWFNQPLFERASIPVGWFGPIMAAALGLQTLVALATPIAGRRLGTPLALAISCLVPGAAYLALARFGAPLPAVLLVAAVVAGGAWRPALLGDALNRRIGDGARATTLSSLSFLGALAGMGLNPLIGMAGDMGLRTAASALGLGLTGLGACMLLLVPFCARQDRWRSQSN